jgi:phosphatidate cytidylyltransferase
MTWTVFYITSVYFLVGGLGIFFINRKKGGSGERWMKFFVYALIVFGVENAIVSVQPFPYLCAAILLAGFNEVIYVWRWYEKRRMETLLYALLVFAAAGYAFFEFSGLTDNLMQLFLYLVVLTFDGFSQVCGQLMGRTRFTGKVSPNKTLEGTLGGLVMALATTYILRDQFNMGLAYMLGLTAVICCIALAGDLLASWYKRLHHAKDFSRLIPGHGGVLDRFDSFIAVGAAWWLATYLGWV